MPTQEILELIDEVLADNDDMVTGVLYRGAVLLNPIPPAPKRHTTYFPYGVFSPRAVRA